MKPAKASSEDIRKKRILVVYSAFPTRSTILDGLLAFRRYSGARVYQLNLRLGAVPWYIMRMKFDLIIFQTTFFSTRYDAAAFQRTAIRAGRLKELRGIKIALPQDEYINVDVVNDFMREFAIDAVFSVQPEAEWDTIYGALDRSRVRIFTVLTGYLDELRLRKLEAFRRNRDRPIDVGYRTTGPPPMWFGRHGMLKQAIADRFLDASRRHGMHADISTSAADTLFGDEWYRFLSRCKYMLGVEGGTSILDFDGSVKERTEVFLEEHPGAAFEEVEKACFPGVDNSFHGFMISPRHLEACALGTCQVLTEGHYNGILRSNEDYIPVKSDFSNLDEVCALIRADEDRERIVESAYRKVVVSGEYTYRAFVDFVLTHSGVYASRRESTIPDELIAKLVHRWMRMREAGDRTLMVVQRVVVAPLKQRFLGARLKAS